MAKPKRVLSVHELKTAAEVWPVVIDLPPAILAGIGSILSLYAYMEWRLALVVYALLDIDQPEGRIAWDYQHPNKRAQTIRSLFQWNGVPIDMAGVITAVRDLGIIRDQLAHGLWLQRGDNDIRLQTIREHTEVPFEPDGPNRKSKSNVLWKHDFLPVAIDVSGDYFKRQRAAILALIHAIEPLLVAAKQVQEKRRAKITEDAAAGAPE